jgi:hypothetical protein
MQQTKSIYNAFAVGNAGTGKTQVWKTLFKTYQNLKKKPVFCDLNPKAVTNDELYGIINPATRYSLLKSPIIIMINVVRNTYFC